jgi:hypothetical protein
MEEELDEGNYQSAGEAETFLGGLRSELDEGSQIHPAFASMAAAADSVRASYLSYAITPNKAAEAFRLLRVTDESDIEWTVGPSSGSWYRRRVGSSTWQPGPPPLMAEPKSGGSTPWMSSELSDLLPSARSASNTTQSDNLRSQAGIRVVDVSELPKLDEGETRDWLLSEWDELEVQLDVLRQQTLAATAEREREELAVAVELREPVGEDLGLPEVEDVTPEPLDDLDLFVRPEPRQDAVALEDLLERGPSPRTEAVTPGAQDGPASEGDAAHGSEAAVDHATEVGSDYISPPEVPNSPDVIVSVLLSEIPDGSTGAASDEASPADSTPAHDGDAEDPYGLSR